MQSVNPVTDSGESWSSKRVRVNGFVESLDVVLDLRGPENRVRGKGYFYDPFTLPTRRDIRFHSFDVEILAEPARDSAILQNTSDAPTDPASVGDLYISYSEEKGNEYIHAQLTLRIEQSAWNTLADKANTAARIHLDLILEPKGRHDGSGHIFYRVCPDSFPEIRLSGGLKLSQLAATIRQRELQEHLRSNYIERGQLMRMAEELAETAARAPNPPDPRSYALIIGELFCDLQIALRIAQPAPGAKSGSIWGLNPKGFRELLGGMSSGEANVLRANYDTVWWKYNLLLVVHNGENTSGAKPDGFEPNPELLEEVAVKYLQLPAGYSQTLEWILIDALIYADCITYARTVLSNEKFLGVPVPAEIKGLDSGEAWRAELKNMVGRGLLEALKLIVTFAFAAGVSNASVQTMWIIVVGVTAARWIRSAILRPPQESKKTALLESMIAVHRSIKFRFSSSHILYQLNKVTYKGAVFSSKVYELLDARIKAGR